MLRPSILTCHGWCMRVAKGLHMLPQMTMISCQMLNPCTRLSKGSSLIMPTVLKLEVDNVWRYVVKQYGLCIYVYMAEILGI